MRVRVGAAALRLRDSMRSPRVTLLAGGPGVWTLALVLLASDAGSPPTLSNAAAARGGLTVREASTTSAGPCDARRLIEGRWPSGCWRPYGPASPFNQRLPAKPRLAPNSAELVAQLLSYGRIGHMVAGEAETADDYSHPVYFSRPDDPVFTLQCYETSWGRCEIEGHQVRIPDAARPAAGGDAHLTVVSRESGWEYDLYKVRSKPAGGGTLTFRWGGRTRIDGDGLRSGGTASGFGGLAGIIRASELAAGKIEHALFMVAKCDSGGWVYPAAQGGRSCAELGLPTRSALPMGARLRLAMSPAQIAALRVPTWKKTILRAMSRYGMFVGDTGGGAWGIHHESGSSYTSFGRADPLVTFARKAGWRRAGERYIADLYSGVDWRRYLRVVHPCVTQRTC